MSSPPNNITFEPTSVADCPVRATWEQKKLKKNKDQFNHYQSDSHVAYIDIKRKFHAYVLSKFRISITFVFALSCG